jgi:tetratricopeptide (TPR) repeat protein
MSGTIIRRVSLLFVVAFLLSGSRVSLSQNPPATQAPAQSTPSDSRNRPSNSTTPANSDTVRPVFLSGNVKLPDGSNPPGRVVIERVCGASIRPEGYTDSNGFFSFMVSNQNATTFFDASVSGEGLTRADVLGRQRTSDRNLTGCEIRASLSGYLSNSIMLGVSSALDNPYIGTITIRPLASVEGYTVSATTGLASRDARKAYEKGVDYTKEQKWADAEREFANAVRLYPNYAIAWLELGKVHQRLKKNDEANNDYRQALQIDPKFVGPYAPLIALQTNQRKWEEVTRDFSNLMKLDRYPGADMYFYAAVANYNLDNKDVAEQQVREAAKLDSQRKIPKINHLLGVILAEKQDYAGARENIQIYLKLSPNATDGDVVRKLLAEIESKL